MLRLAEPEDLERILEIENSSFSVPWSRTSFMFELESPDAHVTVAEDGGVIVGFAVMHRADSDGELYNIAVSRECRGRRIGTGLLEEALQWAESEKLQTVFLEVRESNAPALSLYRSHGFEKLGIRKNYYHSPVENAVIMENRIDGGR